VIFVLNPLDEFLLLFAIHPVFFVFLLHKLVYSSQPFDLLRQQGQLFLIFFIGLNDLFVFLLEHDQAVFHIDQFNFVVAFGDGQIGDQILGLVEHVLVPAVV